MTIYAELPADPKSTTSTIAAVPRPGQTGTGLDQVQTNLSALGGTVIAILLIGIGITCVARARKQDGSQGLLAIGGLLVAAAVGYLVATDPGGVLTSAANLLRSAFKGA